MIERKQKLDWDSLRDTAEAVEGSFTFTVLSEDDKLYFIKGDSPMKIFHYPTLGVYLYASTENILRSALRGCGNWLGSGVELPISIGEMLSIDDSGIIEHANFDAGNLFSYGRYYGAPLCRPAFSACSSYVQELKDIASAFGYTPEDIDELLSCGFSPEEIEDYFYESGEDAYAHIGYVFEAYQSGYLRIVSKKKRLEGNRDCLLKGETLFVRSAALVEYIQSETPLSSITKSKLGKLLAERRIIPESAEKRSASAKLNGVRYLPIDLSALKAAAVRY